MAIVRQALGSKERYEINDHTLEETIGEYFNQKNFEEDKIEKYIQKYGDYFAWGGAGNSFWEKLEIGDIVFFGRGSRILFIGKISEVPEKPDEELAKLLWGEDTWSHIYFLDSVINLKNVPIPVSTFNTVADYNKAAFFRGLSIVKGITDDRKFLLKFILESAEYLERGVEQ